MEKRYQVFVSSTFRDLIDERRAVMQALLELNCIPAGMELFPASSDDQWTLIKSVIDDCDYYLVIVAGRYGSLDPEGISYTEREYDYAAASKKPTMAFLHRDPGSIPARYTDSDPEVARKLKAFREKLERRHCKYWTDAQELGGQISRSYVQLLKAHQAEGWVKGRYAKTTEELEHVNQMHQQIRVLEQEVARLRQSQTRAMPDLAQSEDVVGVAYRPKGNRDETIRTFQTTWNDLLRVVGLECLSPAGENSVREAVIAWIRKSDPKSSADADARVRGDSFRVIKVQFFSLGYLEGCTAYGSQWNPAAGRHESVPLPGWILTPAGRAALAELMAVKRVSGAA